MKKRLLSVILALMMTSSAFTMFACGESEVNNETETSGESSQTPAADETEETVLEETEIDRASIPDDLPDVKFGGQAFHVLTNKQVVQQDHTTEIDVEELTGEACNDAVYNRNKIIEERFDVKILVTGVQSPEEDIITLTTSGSKEYQVVGFQNYTANIPIVGGALMNWLEAERVNLDKPWHNSLANDDAIINGILYAICSDLSVTSMMYNYAMYCNLDLLEKYNHSADELYTLVEEGKWTIDKQIELVAEVYEDSNGDGVKGLEDTYGFGYYPNNPADVWLTAFGGRVCDVKEDGSIELAFMNEKTVNIHEKLMNWHYNGDGFLFITKEQGGSYAEEDIFVNGQLLFSPMRFWTSYSKLRDSEVTYTMVPYPKWDEAQEAYYTIADDKFSVFGLPKTSSGDLEFIGTIYEAMCAESYKTVYPVYYDQALKGRYSTDAQTAEMVDLIMAGRAFDFTFQFSGAFGRLPLMIRDLLKANNANIASEYASKEDSIITAVNEIFTTAYGTTLK